MVVISANAQMPKCCLFVRKSHACAGQVDDACLLLQVWDPEKIVIIPDHYIFTSDARANRNVDILRYSIAIHDVLSPVKTPLLTHHEPFWTGTLASGLDQVSGAAYVFCYKSH